MYRIPTSLLAVRTIAMAVAALLMTTVVTSVYSRASASYAEPFNGRPTWPEPWRSLDWDLTAHSRDPDTWRAPLPMDAAHGVTCAAPPAVHAVNSYDDTVFLCNDHS